MVATFNLPALLALSVASAFAQSFPGNVTLMQLNATLSPGTDAPLPTTQMLGSYKSGYCGKYFEEKMNRIGAQQWCNWTAVARPYSELTNCTEFMLEWLSSYWPNEVGEMLFVQIHHQYFLSCRNDAVQILTDPPDNTVLGLITVPICIISIMVCLVVWCSKNSEANAKK
ncbi:receptor activity-modifying protein 2 isoform X2 [Narcine bancroftii]|uniref:receptor activity-modifying protein 2 isoform X2 n=1 Tax=Narcine bancroftii TaxID=1343680 RepID=UPI003831B73D